MILNNGTVTAPPAPTTTVRFDAPCACGQVVAWQVIGSDRVGDLPVYRIECDCINRASSPNWTVPKASWQ